MLDTHPRPTNNQRIGYVVKRYPRFSETFIVNEILAHEAAGADLEIFSIRPCNDTHFQDRIAQVRAPLTQLPAATPKASVFLATVRDAAKSCPHIWKILERETHADSVTILQAIELAELVRQRNIGHLHAHFASLPAAVARLAAKLAQITYSVTAHAKDIFHEHVNPDDLRSKFVDASAVITVSDFNIEYIRSEFPAAAAHVHRVYNGMDLDQLPYQDAAQRPRTIVAVGRLVEKKGFGYLVAACELLRERGVDFHCQIVGSGDEQDHLRAMIADRQLQNLVTMSGPRPQQDIKNLVQDAAVMAAPCVVGEDGNRDGLPTVLLEAMALGTPCVATDVTGIPEVVQHEQTGLIVPQHDAESLSWALERLLDDGQLRRRMAAAARQLIEAEFDSTATSAAIRHIFDGSSTTHLAETLLEESLP